MTEQANRIDWLERQLAQVNEFIERDTLRLAENPNKRSIKHALNSWLSHKREIEEELRQEKESLINDVIELTLLGNDPEEQVHIAIMHELLQKFMDVIGVTAHTLKYGKHPKRGVPDDTLDDVYIKLFSISHAPYKLTFVGDRKYKTRNRELLPDSLRRIFDLMECDNPYHRLTAVAFTGPRAAKDLANLFELLEDHTSGIELSWTSSSLQRRHWKGTTQNISNIKSWLHTLSRVGTEEVILSGKVTPADRPFVISIVDDNGNKINIFYSEQQKNTALAFKPDGKATFKAVKYTQSKNDPTVFAYRLLTEQ